MISSSHWAKHANAAALLAAFTSHCSSAQPSDGQLSVTPAVQTSDAAASSAAAASGGRTSAVSQPSAAGQGGTTSARATTGMGAAGSGRAGGGNTTGATAAGAASAGPSGHTTGTAAAAGAASAETGGSAIAGAGGSAGSGARNSTMRMDWPAVTDFSMKGTFTSVTQNNTGPMNAYTLYYPKEAGRDGLKHPSVTWGNGATTTPNLFSLLPLLASHGFVIIAANDSFVTSAEMKSGLDWLVDENERQDSVLHQKLDASKLAAMGYPLGSMGAFEMAGDPRLKTTVHISGGAMDKAVLPNLHEPAAFFCGDSSDIAHDNCESDFEMAKVPVFYGVFPGDHLGILGSHATQINRAVATWLRWRLMDDATLDMSFVGKDCAVCQDAGWAVKQRDLDTAP